MQDSQTVGGYKTIGVVPKYQIPSIAQMQPNIPIKFRKKIRSFQKKVGQKIFFKKLIELDSLVKERIKPSDVQRSIRAYEVKAYTKKSLIEWFKNTKSKFSKDDFSYGKRHKSYCC